MLKTRPKPPVEAQDRSLEVARDIGRRLREARTSGSETIDAVADQLRIRPAYIEALEAGEFGRIPGRPYVVGFLRSYGAHLGLDGEQLVASLKSSTASVTAPPELVYRGPIAESRRGTAVMLTASALLAAAVYSGYYMIYHVDRGGKEPVAEAPGEMARLATDTLRRADENRIAAAARPPAAPAGAMRAAPPANERAAALRPPAAASTGALQALVAEDDDPSEARAASVIGNEARTSTPSSASAAPASTTELLAALESDRINAARPAVASDDDAEGRLTLVARETTWVQVRSTGRDYVRTRTMQRGDRFALPDRGDLALWTGNAGGIELVVDGQSRGQLGLSGEVVRNRSLAPDQLGGGPARGG
jgi:cytoskeleton protein RodZ